MVDFKTTYRDEEQGIAPQNFEMNARATQRSLKGSELTLIEALNRARNPANSSDPGLQSQAVSQRHHQSLQTTYFFFAFIMQFNFGAFATLAAALAAVAPSALAASCYSSSGCKQCESESSVYAARQQFCGSDDWSHSSSISWGWAHVTLDGRFYSQQECWDGFENIIEQCYGHKNGGIYTYDYNGDSARLDVNFCNCE
ncbi:hypothetical protein C8Q70DRAFT_1107075 [Cubamyces menziesii]|nr:hypothetical protein C8Q70DRAFT_1107075 [Cubamyces menziesii]